MRDEPDFDDTTRALGELADLSGLFGRALSGAFRAAAVDGRKLDDVLRDLAERLSDRALTAAFRPLESALGAGLNGLFGSLTAGLSGALPFAAGGVIAGGRPLPFAEGGVVERATLFPLAGRAGLMGEAGAEAILPLARGPDGRLGVASGDHARPIHVTFNVTTPDAESFTRSEAQIGGMLARAVGRGRRGL